MINLMKPGYPMYQQISKRNTPPGKSLTVDVVCDPDKTIGVEEELSVEKIYGKVTNVLDQRPSRGRHKSPKTWQRLEIECTRNLMFE